MIIITIGVGKVVADTISANDTELVQNALGTIASKRCLDNVCSTQGGGQAYWLASRSYEYNNSIKFYFDGRYIVDSGSVSSNIIRYYDNDWKDTNKNYALRPIVTLKSGLTPAKAVGSKDNPFVLS